jgi:hypothetical protein
MTPIDPRAELSGKYILSCHQTHVDQTWYVAQLPGDGGVSWGWVTTLAKAVPVSPYWVRRFRSDMRHVGRSGVAWGVE